MKMGLSGMLDSNGIRENNNPNGLLSGIFSEYPKLQIGNDPLKTNVTFANNQRQGLSGNRRLEYWPPQEPGTPDMPHPNPGNTTLEIFDPKLKNNPELLKNSIKGDLLHGMANDPIFNSLRTNFAEHYTPEALEMDKKQGLNPLSDSRLDEYVRGYISPDENAEFMNAYNSGQPVYSPKQIQLLQMMKAYMGMQK